MLVARKATFVLAALLIVAALLVVVGRSNAVSTSGSESEPFCLSDELLSRSLRSDPALQRKMDEQETAIRKYTKSHPDTRQMTTSNFIIPVVVYIVHQGGPENISEQQVNSQIAALNAAFSGRGVQFCLATTQGATPLPGSPTPGIIRIHSSLTNHLTSQESSLKALSTLPGDKYLRIWVVNDIDNHSGVVGYARFPGGAPALEGIVMRYDVFGNAASCGCSNLLPKYDQGKVLAHEVGHYLYLYHTFQSGCSGVSPSDCATLGDRVCDTPQIAVADTGCPSSPVLSCNNTPALIDNHMDYTNDLCRDDFTAGQDMRMLATLNSVRQPLVSPANLVFTGVQCAGMFNAAFVASNFNPCTNQNVTFDALNVSGGAYVWDFGDNSTTNGDPVTHAYTTAGTYNVTLTVTSGGNSVSISQQVFVTACAPISSSQANWYFGGNAGLNFSTGAPIAVLDNGISFAEACVTQSDAAGNLLFYSNSVKVFDRTHAQMAPGTLLSGDDSASNGAISIPDPGNANRYYLIYRSLVAGFPRLSYTIVNFGNPTFQNGELTSIDTLIAAPAPIGGEQITAVPNCAGTGYWLIAHSTSPQSVFFVFSLTAGGISSPVSYPGALPSSIGILKASPDGTMIAQTGQSHDAAVFNFDRATGAITPRYNLATGNAGCSFSPDSKLLYTAGNSSFGVGIFQYDLSVPDPNTSMRVVTNTLNAAFGFVILQLGPDKKIYASQWGNDGRGVGFLPVINYPNELNTAIAPNACGYSVNGPFLQGRNTYIGLPNMIDALPAAQIPADFSYALSSCSTVNFSAPSCATYAWTFGDGATSNAQNPTHVYASNGTYAVTLTLNGSSVLTQSILIGVPDSAASISGPTQVCQASGNPTFHNYSVNAQPGLTYNWTVTGGAISGISNSDNIDVAWSTLPGTVQLTVMDQATGCSLTKTRSVIQNCNPSPCRTIALPVFNTGVDNNGSVLADGAVDPHYTLTLPGGAPGTPLASAAVPSWVPNSTVSKWLTPSPVTGSGGQYTYVTKFNLCANPRNVVITGRWASDNEGFIRVNGGPANLFPTTVGGFGAFTTFTLDSNSTFKPGINTLEFVVTNQPHTPTGVRVEMSGTAQCCPVWPWNIIGAGATVNQSSGSLIDYRDFSVRLKDGLTGTAVLRYNITAVSGITVFCPATESMVSVRFRNSDNSGTHAQVKLEIHRTHIFNGGNDIIYSFNSNGVGAGNAFTTVTATPNIDFDFRNHIYWIEATIFRDQANQFADLGSIEIYESDGTTACP